QLRDEQLPNPARSVDPHGMHAAVPPVEVPDHANTLRVRGPDSETHPAHAVALLQVRPESPPGLTQPTLVEQVQVVAAQGREESVSVVDIAHFTAFGDPQAIGFG